MIDAIAMLALLALCAALAALEVAALVLWWRIERQGGDGGWGWYR